MCIRDRGRTYREFGPDGAGFFFDFDPEYGYESEPSGFGTSFHTIPHKTYTHILEYGFTGRQLNIALDLAMHSEDYFRKAERVIDFFVNYCITEKMCIRDRYGRCILGKGGGVQASWKDRSFSGLFSTNYGRSDQFVCADSRYVI